MATFRKINTSFWSDSFISDLDKDKKLFYLYLLTNERTTQCGIYEITKKQISYDLGYSIDTVSKLILYFIKSGKIRYNEQTNELAIKKWSIYNGSTSPKVQACINKELTKVKDTVLIQYIYSMDTHPQEEEEEEEEKEEEENKIKPKGIQFEIDENFRPCLEKWFKYKKSSYKNNDTKEACYNHLLKLSKNNAVIAAQIVDQSIANTWKGLFELKQSPTPPPQLFTQPTKGHIKPSQYGADFDPLKERF